MKYIGLYIKPDITQSDHESALSANAHYVDLGDLLPLTCVRGGVCCYTKTVWLNPWELARLAAAKSITSRNFRDLYSEFGGIHLRFNGPSAREGSAACCQYIPDYGCSVYDGRPLACRLFPFGRARRGNMLRYLQETSQFPCLKGCPEVVNHPLMTVADYLEGQKVKSGEAAQDAYFEIIQRLADGAFVLLIESGLAKSGDRLTLQLWRQLGNVHPGQLAAHLGNEWIDSLMLPEIPAVDDDPVRFAHRHHDILQDLTQSKFSNLNDNDSLCEASALMMALALYLGSSLGIKSAELAHHWIATAKKHGAHE